MNDIPTAISVLFTLPWLYVFYWFGKDQQKIISNDSFLKAPVIVEHIYHKKPMILKHNMKIDGHMQEMMMVEPMYELELERYFKKDFGEYITKNIKIKREQDSSSFYRGEIWSSEIHIVT